jgi:hypothetical protein
MNVRNVKKTLSLALMASGVLLSACSFERAPDVLQNPFYKSGFSAGCESAHNGTSGFDRTVHRDATLYETEDTYRAGWGDGYASCGGQRQFDENSVFNERRDNSAIRY